ncbi:MAG: hypothetical protein GY853_01305 [PVC group bacterium]|nr:hypothetical protein [PVC group bacterium]
MRDTIFENAALILIDYYLEHPDIAAEKVAKKFIKIINRLEPKGNTNGAHRIARNYWLSEFSRKFYDYIYEFVKNEEKKDY